MKNLKNLLSAGLISIVLISQVMSVSAQEEVVFPNYGGQSADGYYVDCCTTSSNNDQGYVITNSGSNSGSDQGYIITNSGSNGTLYLDSGYSNYGLYGTYSNGYSGSYGTASYIAPSNSWYNTTNPWLSNQSGYSTGYSSGYSSGGSFVSNSNNTTNNSSNSSSLYDNSYNPTYIDNSFCTGSNTCNTTHTNIVSNSTNVNGNYNNVNTGASGSTGSSVNCPNGYSGVNGNCVQNVASVGSNPITNTNCGTGYYYNGSNCVQNNSYNNTPIYTTPIYTTPIYTTPIYNNPIYTTPIYNTPPVYNYPTYKTCNNGVTVSVGQDCYKTCPNGNSVLESQACQRYCQSTGSYVSEYQSCPVINIINQPSHNYVVNYPVNYPVVNITASPMSVRSGDSTQLSWSSSYASYCQASGDWSGQPTLTGQRSVNSMTRTMTFTITCYNNNGQSANDSVTVNVTGYISSYNKAVTTLPTRVTNDSALCNGVAISNNNIANTGSFELREYDNNNNVVKMFNTNSASIGNASSNYYSAPVSGLKSNTKYSCKAIVNNVKGIMKGEELSFTTSGYKVNYISDIKRVIKTGKTIKKEPITVCTDNSGNKMTMIEGAKVLDLSINKLSSNARAGEESIYTITIKNVSGVDINNVNVKLALDNHLHLSGTSDWQRGESGQYINNVSTLYKGSEKTYIVKVIVDKEVNVGDSLISNVYGSYEVKSNKGILKDEVNAYIVDNIISSVKANDKNTSKDTAVKEVHASKTFGQMIDSLRASDWLLILGIIAICGFLIRNIYLAVKKK